MSANDKKIIHFAHANGFPGPCYRKLFSYLEDDYTLGYLERSGHDPDYPVTDNWDHLVNEVIDTIKALYTQPVIGLGHSLGGVLTLMASLKQPELFDAVIILDSPLIGRVRSRLVKILKDLDMIDRVTPARRTKRRRQTWVSREQAKDYFASKIIFKPFDPDCLQDYVDYGLVESDDGYTLKFSREIEYNIYKTLPHRLPDYHGKLTVPAGLIYGHHSDVVRSSDIRNMQKNYGMLVRKIRGGHLFPFESPKAAAANIKKMIKQLRRRQ